MLISILQHSLKALHRVYKWTLSPVFAFFGFRCRFYPYCSDYALESLLTHGPLKGTELAVRRLCKCHPFHPGGYDPVPKKILAEKSHAR